MALLDELLRNLQSLPGGRRSAPFWIILLLLALAVLALAVAVLLQAA